MTEEDRKIEYFMQFSMYKMIVPLTQMGGGIVLLNETLNNDKADQLLIKLNWVRWTAIWLFMLVGNYTKLPIFLKIGFHMKFASMVMLFPVVAQKFVKQTDYSSYILVSFPLILCAFFLFFLPMCLMENAYFHVPVSIIYQMGFSIGIFFVVQEEKKGAIERLKYVFEHLRLKVLILVIAFIII